MPRFQNALQSLASSYCTYVEGSVYASCFEMARSWMHCVRALHEPPKKNKRNDDKILHHIQLLKSLLQIGMTS